MPSLADNFTYERGDLIYGFDQQRKDAIYSDTRLSDLMDSGAWIMVNSFNNTTVLSFSQYFDPKDKTPVDKQKSTIMGSVQEEHKVRAAQFLNGLYQKCPPSGVAHIPKEKLVGEGKGGEKSQRQNKMIRRSCKFGIENVIRFLGDEARVHFLLGGIEPDAATERREYDGKVPITISEIRFVFRNWTKFQNKVIFYDEFYQQQNLAPWQTHPVEWKGYAARRLQKLIAQAELGCKKNMGLKPAVLRAKNIQATITTKTALELVDAGNALRIAMGTLADF